MAHASAHLGMDVSERKRFTDLFNQLTQELGPTWHDGSWSGVQALHRMRNQAQHVGGVADVDQIRGWATDAERFVGALVPAVFAVPLEEVRLAEAVQDLDVGATLIEAEAALDRREATAAFELAWKAFSIARERWERHAWHGQSHSSLSYLGSGIPDDEARQAARNAADLILGFAFASEPAEYVWFRELRGAVGQGVPVDHDDAERALAFVFTWVLRWETFDQRHDPERTRRWRASERPPRVDGAEGPQIAIIEAKVSRPEYSEEPTVLAADLVLQVSNVDPVDLDWWTRQLEGELREGLADIEGAAPFAIVQPNGRLRIGRLAPDVDSDRLLAAVRAALGRTDTAAQVREQRQKEWERVLPGLLEPFQSLVEGIAVDGRPAFVSVTASPHDGWPVDPRDFVVMLSTSQDEPEMFQLPFIAHRISRGMRSKVGGQGGGVATVRGDADLREIRAVLVEAAAEVASEINGRRSAEAERSAAEAALVERLRRSLRG